MSNARPNQFLIILSPPRSRSTYLFSLINSHPLAVCHHEIFHQDKIIILLPDLPEDDALFDKEWRDKHPDLYLERLLEKTQEYNPLTMLTGAKLILYEPQIRLGFDAMLALDPLVIILGRDNKLAWYSSFKISLETDVWQAHEKITQQPQTKFKPHEFEAMMNTSQKVYLACHKKLVERKIRFIEVEYDELTEESNSKILNFLGLPYFDVTVNTVEQNSKDILSRFSNPEEVRSYLTAINRLHWIGCQ